MFEQKNKPKDNLQLEELQPYIRVIIFMEYFSVILTYQLYLVFISTTFCVEYSCVNFASTIFTRER